jgi:hypothetical protein
LLKIHGKCINQKLLVETITKTSQKGKYNEIYPQNLPKKIVPNNAVSSSSHSKPHPRMLKSDRDATKTIVGRRAVQTARRSCHAWPPDPMGIRIQTPHITRALAPPVNTRRGLAQALDRDAPRNRVVHALPAARRIRLVAGTARWPATCLPHAAGRSTRHHGNSESDDGSDQK